MGTHPRKHDAYSQGWDTGMKCLRSHCGLFYFSRTMQGTSKNAHPALWLCWGSLKLADEPFLVGIM